MWSRQDKPEVDMWWREQAFREASRFIVDGIPVGAPARCAAGQNRPVQLPVPDKALDHDGPSLVEIMTEVERA